MSEVRDPVTPWRIGFGAIAVAVCALASAAPAIAHQGNPNYSSEITATPSSVRAEMLNYDDTLQLTVAPGHQLVVEGYEGEPYVRFLGDGTVEMNQNSPAKYLNEDRYGDAAVPAGADPKAPPVWEEVGEHGVFAWHDHRVHYMSTQKPAQVTDESVRTKIFDWKVPVEADGAPTRLAGTLYWVPVEGGPSIGLIAGLVGAVLASLAFAIWRIRRRNRDLDDVDRSPAPEPEEAETW